MSVKMVLKDFPEIVRLEAFADVENIGSQRVLEKAGFKKEGLLRKNTLLGRHVNCNSWTYTFTLGRHFFHTISFILVHINVLKGSRCIKAQRASLEARRRPKRKLHEYEAH
ncbi:acyl-CoA N-acyltransferases superfamily protein [Tanacetum coccineum]